MAGLDENYPGVIGRKTVLGPVGMELAAGVGKNRRALSNIHMNVMRDPQRAVNKRSLSEKLCVPMANKQQCKPERTEKPFQTVPGPRWLEDSTVVDADDYDVSGDTDVPMFVQHTEALMEEIYRMEEEVEMEDVPEELVLDIDSCDKNNPLAVVEYIDDLYKFYMKSEKSSSVSPTYMAQQFDINERMRGILIDWLIEVHYKFELMDETLYLTVNLIDRFLAAKPVVRKKLQLVGVTAMLLACKYEEVSVPVVEDFILISDKAYIREEVLEMEKLMVNTLQFNLSVPTPYVFMRRFLKAAQCSEKVELLSFFVMELCLVEYEMVKFPCSLLAAAAVYTAQSAVSYSKQWSKTSEEYSGYSEEELLECSRLMVRFHEKAGTGKLTGAFRKYSTSKFGYAAKHKPASFLLLGDTF